jgi:mannose-1-phosphate guanylyltransferase
MVLLAIEAHEPETEYGYVVPRQDVQRLCRFGTKSVSAFIEKPGRDRALQLMMAGGLWNTMTMVFKLDTLLDLVRKVHPAIYLKFCRIFEAIGNQGRTAKHRRPVRRVRAGKLFKSDYGEDC